MSRLLTLREAAERLSISQRTLRRMISRGALPVVRLGTDGKSDRIAEVALENYIKRKTITWENPHVGLETPQFVSLPGHAARPGHCGSGSDLRASQGARSESLPNRRV